MAYVEKIIDENPKLYLIYMLFAEQFTVRGAPSLLSALEERCGISRSDFSAIANHETLDKDHVNEDLDIINQFIGEPQNPKIYLDVIDHSFSLVDSFLAEMATTEAPVWN